MMFPCQSAPEGAAECTEIAIVIPFALPGLVFIEISETLADAYAYTFLRLRHFMRLRYY